MSVSESEFLNNFKCYKLILYHQTTRLCFLKCREQIANIIKHKQEKEEEIYRSDGSYYHALSFYNSMIEREIEDARYWFNEFIENLSYCPPNCFDAVEVTQKESTQDEMQS